MGIDGCRGRHQKHHSVKAIRLRYVFALLHNASTLRRKVIAACSYRSELIEVVIASYSYRSVPIGIVSLLTHYRSKIIISLLLHIVMLLTAFSNTGCSYT
jgi:hypothetical protein